jgi:23S rRNA (guanosine2251-2'-O)-methyltransferase
MKEKEMIFGLRAVIEAAEAGKDIDKVLVKRDLQGELFRELQNTLRHYNIPMQRVPVEKLESLTRKNHQGVVAYISAVTYYRLEEVIPRLFEEGRNRLFWCWTGSRMCAILEPLRAPAKWPAWMRLSFRNEEVFR